MEEIILNEEELKAIQTIVKEITCRYQSVEDAGFVKDASLYAQEMPRGVRVSLNDFRLKEPPSGVCLIRGHPIDEAKIGRTPTHWKWRSEISATLEEEITLALYGSLLGDLLTWGTQQDGHIVQDVFPIEGYENEQLGAGSTEPLWWHNEDAFHPYRADYLGLMCLRNPDHIATTVASISTVKIAQDHVNTLFESRFSIRPDDSHFEKSRSDLRKEDEPTEELVSRAYQRIENLHSEPPRISILFGDPVSPYMRLDRFLVDRPDDEQACSALDALIQAMDSILSEVVLEPGDCLFLDNYRAVHGRKAFNARYDGQDRWLKRINIARDLRKSRNARSTPTSRVIF